MNKNNTSPLPAETPWTEDADRLYEQGLINATQAALKSGQLAVEHSVPAETTPKPASPPSQRPKQPKRWERIDRRNLSARGKLLADEPPAHIKRPYPYED